MKPVGILGGMGPAATVLLMQKALAAVQARDDSDHIPLIVHQNPQVPSRIAALVEGGGTDPAPVLAQMARDLAAAGAQTLAMPCNTAHSYANVLRMATGLPFLDMTQLAAVHLGEQRAQKVGILASPAVRMVNVYSTPLAKAGIQVCFAEDDSLLLEQIRAVKAGHQGDAGALAQISRALLNSGCDHILVACTEFSLLTPQLPADIPWTDSLDVLVDAIVESAHST